MHHLSSHIGETEDEAMRGGGGGLALVHVFPSFPTESGDWWQENVIILLLIYNLVDHQVPYKKVLM